MSIDPSLQWYCLRACPKREHFAARQLTERTGLEAFAPRLAVRRPGRGEALATRTEALFPGYFFARFDLGTNSRFVASTPDVSGIVRLGSYTPAVPESLIELLRTHASGQQPFAPVLAPGDWIEVLSGCLAGSEGRIVTFDSGRSRAWVLLALLGQELRINLPAAALRRTGPASLDFPPQLLASCG
jgi:transcriptional antiterminator RfaH